MGPSQVPVPGSLRLVDDRKLKLDDRAFRLLKGIKPLPGDKLDPRLGDVTVRQMLHHAGGLASGPGASSKQIAKRFKPKPGFARDWAKLAKAAGQKYMVMTTKHHEGFCNFDSKLTDYCAPKQGPGRDLVKEYVEAARAEGLRVGFYYSLMDWHHPDGARCAPQRCDDQPVKRGPA